MNEDINTTETKIGFPNLNWKSFLLGILIGLLLSIHSCSCVQAQSSPARNLEDIHAASCRVFAMDSNGRGAIGTGTICGLVNGKYYILTNWHVVESHRSVTLQFFGNGRITECKGTVIATWHNESQPYDFAIITVSRTDLSNYNPPFVPLAQRGTRPTTGGLIMSSGCSEGRWPFAWKGSIESYYGETAQFFPAPKGGQSGSAIVEELNGQLCITGILTWRVGDEKKLSEEEMRGGAIPISKLYEAFDGKHRTGLPSSVPPNAVWCKAAGNADVSSASSTGQSSRLASQTTSKSKETETKDDKKHAIKKIDPKIDSKDEAVLQIEPEVKKKLDLPIEVAVDRPKVHAIGSTEDYKTPVSQKVLVEVIFFTSTYCIPCKQAEPIVAEMCKKGYTIHTVKIDDDTGRKLAFERQVTSTPTFVVYRSEDNRATWTEISRFSGTGNLKERLLQSFSLGNSGGNSGGSGGQTTPDVKPDTGGLSQLFDEYENGFRDRFRNNPNEGTFPDAGDDSGLFRSDRGLFQMIRNEIKIFIWSLFKWALLMIVAFWFSVNAILWGLKKLGGWLPKISVSLKRKSDTQNEE